MNRMSRVAVTGLLGAGLAVTAAVPAFASPTAQNTAGQTAFCNAWGRFGDSATFANLTAVHTAAPGANKETRSDFYEYQWALLHAQRKLVITRGGAVWHDCGFPA